MEATDTIVPDTTIDRVERERRLKELAFRQKVDAECGLLRGALSQVMCQRGHTLESHREG